MANRVEVGRPRNARINQAIKHASELLDCLGRLSGKTHRQHVDEKDAWADGRNALEQLTQCFHEANAYNNALLAQRIEHEPSKLGVEGSNPSERANGERCPSCGIRVLAPRVREPFSIEDDTPAVPNGERGGTA